MKPKTVSLMYFIGGSLFLMAGLRYALVKDDMIGAAINSINTILFYVLAYAAYKKKIYK
jgi:hypothetical protein